MSGHFTNDEMWGPAGPHAVAAPECSTCGLLVSSLVDRGGCGLYGGAPEGKSCYVRDSAAAKAADEDRQRARSVGYDAGWESAWEVVTGGTAVDLPWPERLRLIARITGAAKVEFTDEGAGRVSFLGQDVPPGAALIVYLGEPVPESERNAEFLPVPEPPSRGRSDR